MADIQPITQQLIDLIEANGWRDKFCDAISAAQSFDVPQLAKIDSLDAYLEYVNDMVTWTPREVGDSQSVYLEIVKFYFILDQEPLRSLQSPIQPGADGPLTPLSQWIVDFANAWGLYMDTPESASMVASFKTDPAFDWDAYVPPPSGYLTFNQFFARHTKPGVRPISAISDNSVVVSPADCTFVGWWPISETSSINVYGKNQDNVVTVKGIRWSIEQLLEGSEYADRFRGGVFTHSFLNTYDYHRWHAPVQGKVLEARVIPGQAYLDVDVVPKLIDGEPVPHLNALDNTGYQFVQSRGLVVLDSPIGLVACLPMGMAQVSSVVLTAEVGKTLHKGEELGYFQFGGSDFVMVFERDCNVQLINRVNQHYNQGTMIGHAYPYPR